MGQYDHFYLKFVNCLNNVSDGFRELVLVEFPKSKEEEEEDGRKEGGKKGMEKKGRKGDELYIYTEEKCNICSSLF